MSKVDIVESTLQTARTHKEKGSALLQDALSCQDEQKSALFVRSLREYHNALLHLRSVDASESAVEGMDELVRGLVEQRHGVATEQKSEICQLKVQVWNNMSLIYIKQGRSAKAREVIEKVLHLDPVNAKALYRAVAVYIDMECAEEAERVLSKAIAQKVVDAEEENVLRHKIAQIRRKESAALQAAFKNYST